MRTPEDRNRFVSAVAFRFNVIGATDNGLDDVIKHMMIGLVRGASAGNNLNNLAAASDMTRALAYEVLEAYATNEAETFVETAKEGALANLKDMLMYKIQPLLDEDEDIFEVSDETLEMAVDDLVKVNDTTKASWGRAFGYDTEGPQYRAMLKPELRQMWRNYQEEMRDAE